MPFEEVGVRAVVKDARGYVRDLDRMDKRTKRFGGAFGGLAKQALAVGAGFVAAQVGMAGVKTIMSKTIGAALKFEAQLAQIRALTGATAEDTEFLEGAIKDMARELPKSPAELGAGAYFILSSGIEDAADAAGVLEVAAKASTIGLGETESVANALTTVLNAYGKSAGEAGQVTDVMIEAVKQGKAEASEFAGVLGRVVPLAAQMGISFEEVAANLATFTRLGVSAEEAATGLRQVMASLLKPTEDQEEAMAELGLSAEGLRKQIREKGLLVTLDAMTKATGGNETAIARLFPNIRALTSVLGTAGVQMEDYTNILAATENATGNLEEGFGIVADTAQFKMQRAMGQLNVALLDLGEKILPLVVDAAATLSTAVNILTLDFKALGDSIKTGIAEHQKWLGALGEGVDKTLDLRSAIEGQIDVLKEDAQALREGGETTADVAKETSAYDEAVKALANSLGLSEDALRDSGLSTQALRKETQELRDLIARSPAAWADFDRAIAAADATTVGFADAANQAASSTMTLEEAMKGLLTSIQAISGAQKENMATLSELAGARTQEQVALDQQINSLALEQNAAEMAEIGQSSLGGATTSTTDAIDKQVGALQNLAASMVPQALNNEIIALDRELKVLELGKAAIEAQINARSRLAQAQLAMARVANLPAMLELKKLELKREELLAKQSTKTLKLEKEKAKLLAKADPSDADKERIKAIDALLAVQKAAIKQIDDEMEALSRGIHIKTLEAEITNLQAEASDKNREAMQRELNKITDQIGATTDLKNERELYIDTLVPIELLQEIDELGRQKEAMGNAETATREFKGATQSLSETIGEQIEDLKLQREKIDLVTEGWRLQGEEMLGLPTVEDVTKGFGDFQKMIMIGLKAELLAALSRGEYGLVNQLAQEIAKIGSITFAQHGFHGEVGRPTLFLAGEAGRERVDISPQAQPVLAPSVPPLAAPAAGGGTDPGALASAVAFALQGLTVEMDGRIVGSLVNDRIGDRTFQLGRGG